MDERERFEGGWVVRSCDSLKELVDTMDDLAEQIVDLEEDTPVVVCLVYDPEAWEVLANLEDMVEAILAESEE